MVSKGVKVQLLPLTATAPASDPAEALDAVGDVGEVWVSSPNLSPGYYRDPEATARCFVQGWYRTGDVCKVGPLSPTVLYMVHSLLHTVEPRP